MSFNHRHLLTALACVFALAFVAACAEDDRVVIRMPRDCPGPRAASDDPLAHNYIHKIVNIYGHDPGSSTQGLAWVDTVLIEGTGWNNGPATLRRVDLETGTVLQIRETPINAFGEGVTQVGDRIIQLTWVKNIAFIYDAATFDSLGIFTYPTRGWGLTHDDSRFIMTDGTDTLYFRDFDTFEEIGRVTVTENGVPVRKLNELEYIDGEVWANIFETDDIVVIDPSTGDITARINLTGLQQLAPGSRGVLNGIAYNAETCRLFVTGKLWTKLFEIELVPND